MKLILGDSLVKLKNLPTSTIDAVVTDPPYGLSFMGKKWDYDVPSVDLWREAFRVLKPGGHVLSFGGTRTYHRMVVNIEDAGFEIRDQIQWLYGSGFPKSHDVSKAIDKQAGADREVVGVSENNRDRSKHNYNSVGDVGSNALITKAATDDAKKWQGWGSALKPANEPICLARKPLEKGLTLAQNVLKWGTGAINVDASRIAGEPITTIQGGKKINGNNFNNPEGNGEDRRAVFENTQGRWPANLILDEAAAEMLDEQSGVVKSGGNSNLKSGFQKEYVGGKVERHVTTFLDRGSGGASRFFYVAKSSRKDRSNNGAVQNIHPTVKPVKLMEYLIKLVTPPNGIVLDPFMGSGTTGVACKNLGFEFIGIEMNEEYFEIAKNRISQKSKKQLPLEATA